MRCPHCNMILNWSLRECPRCENINPGFRGKEKKIKNGIKNATPSLGFTGNIVMKVFSCIANKATSGFDEEDGWYTTTTTSSSSGKGMFSGDTDFRDMFQAFTTGFGESDSGFSESGAFDFGNTD